MITAEECIESDQTLCARFAFAVLCQWGSLRLCCACVSLCIAACTMLQDCSNLFCVARDMQGRGTCMTRGLLQDSSSILGVHNSITAVGMVLFWFSAAVWHLCHCCAAPSQIRFCVTMRTCTCVCTCHNYFPMRVLQVVCQYASVFTECVCV